MVFISNTLPNTHFSLIIKVEISIILSWFPPFPHYLPFFFFENYIWAFATWVSVHFYFWYFLKSNIPAPNVQAPGSLVSVSGWVYFTALRISSNVEAFVFNYGEIQDIFWGSKDERERGNSFCPQSDPRAGPGQLAKGKGGSGCSFQEGLCESLLQAQMLWDLCGQNWGETFSSSKWVLFQVFLVRTWNTGKRRHCPLKPVSPQWVGECTWTMTWYQSRAGKRGWDPWGKRWPTSPPGTLRNNQWPSQGCLRFNCIHRRGHGARKFWTTCFMIKSSSWMSSRLFIFFMFKIITIAVLLLQVFKELF